MDDEQIKRLPKATPDIANDLSINAKNILSWLKIALFLFAASYFIDIPAKTSRNLFYVFYALPVIFFTIRERKHIRFPFDAHSVPVFVFFALAILGELLSIEGNLRDVIKHTIYLTILFSGVSYLAKHGGNLRWGFIILGFLSLAYLSFPLYKWVEALATEGISKRIHAYDLNVSRSSLLITFGLFSLWLFFLEPWLEKKSTRVMKSLVFFGVVLLTGMVAIIFQSRSTVIALGLFLIFYGIMQSYLWQVALMVVCIAGIVIATGFHDVLLERGMSYRGAIWEDALLRINRDCSWLTGCGSGGNYRFAGQFQNPHSAYIATLYYYGLPALIALLFLMYKTLSKGLREKNPYLALSAVGWGGAIASSTGFIDAPEPQWVYLWIPVFLTLASTPTNNHGS